MSSSSSSLGGERRRSPRARSRGRSCRRRTSRRRARSRCRARAASQMRLAGLGLERAPSGQSVVVRQDGDRVGIVFSCPDQRQSTLPAGQRALGHACGPCGARRMPRCAVERARSPPRCAPVVGAGTAPRSALERGARSRARSAASSRSPSSRQRRCVASMQRVGLDLLLAQRARLHVVRGVRVANPAACARSRRRPGRRTASPRPTPRRRWSARAPTPTAGRRHRPGR